jgi:hypothetical protein
MTLLRKSIPQFLMAMFTVMGVLLGTAASHVVVIPSSAFAQTSSSLAQDIVNLAQQEETDQSSSYEG